MKPVLAIVGRPNVGKSALFNRIAGKQISLVHDRAGVTRDRVTHECVWRDHAFTLMDTGGIGLDDRSGFEAAIQREVNIALETATDLLLVVDGRAGVNPLDVEVARKLRRADKRVALVVNKLDTPETQNLAAEFYQLGFENVFPLSAAHGLGVEALMASLSKHWEKSTADADPAADAEFRVALVGRPNVGKSSLINALLRERRVIVSDIAGTTRDAVDVAFTHGDTDYVFVDTAGMRKKSRVKDALEQAMTSRTAHTINRAHLCVLVIDAPSGVSEQEKKIAGLIHEAGKPCVILVNKWDLSAQVELPGFESTTPREFLREYAESVKRQLFFVNYAPVLMVSAAKEKNLGLWLRVMEQVRRVSAAPLPTGQVNRVIQRAMQRHLPSSRQGRQLKIYYVSAQKETHGTPTLKVFINDRELWTPPYERFLEQQIRAEFDLTGCPLKWLLRDKKEPLTVKPR
ncbi:MAG: ribosome biogenesis GTPase Der [Verrucomicrobiales bacterium]|jgi:GTP-binding protein|nr:ribosome biogenesis GTPase Der [Verrucomicrobiales bacterium]